MIFTHLRMRPSSDIVPEPEVIIRFVRVLFQRIFLDLELSEGTRVAPLSRSSIRRR